MIKADYHVHSEFSRDSQTPMADQVARAVELGFQELCFAEHVDYGIAVDPSEDAPIVYLSGQPMINVDYPAYFAKLASLRQAYADRIKIQAGLEFGVQLETIPQFEQLFHKYEDQLDFILLSCHQAEGKGFWTGEFQQGRTQQEYNEGYYDAIYHVMQNYKDYSILAHLDLIVRRTHRPGSIRSPRSATRWRPSSSWPSPTARASRSIHRAGATIWPIRSPRAIS